MSNPYDDDLSRFAAAFMRAIVAWNNAEDSARRILIDFGGRSIGLRIAAEQLGSRAMKEALLTLCDLLSGDDAPGSTEVATSQLNALAGLLPPAVPLSLLPKPTWPEKLKKHRSYLGER